jgi:EmrB/QacA subfamily drug resistance transporter
LHEEITHLESSSSIRRAALIVASMSSFLTPFMGSSINLAIPSIQNDFSMDALSIAWIATSYLLFAAMFLVPFGKIADIHGRKRIFTYGIILDTIASFLCAISFSATSLIAFRFLQGFGDAMIFGTSVAILTTVYPPEQRGRVLGISVAATYIGLSTGPFFGGILTQILGWRSVFLFIILLDLMIIIALKWLKGEWFGTKGEKFDSLGSVMYAAMLLAIIYGFTLLPSQEALWLILAGVVGLVAFIGIESRVRTPVLDLKLFRHNTVFAFSNLAALINYMATFAVTFLLSLYLQDIKGLTAGYSGIILVCQPAVMAIVSPLAGRLSDRVESRVISSVGMATIAVSLMMLTLLSEATSLVFVAETLLLLGLGFGLFSSPNMNAVMGSVDRRFYGVASATLGTMRLTGQAFSLGITTLVFALIIGPVIITPPYYPLLMASMKSLFLVFAVLCFIGVFASLARGRAHRSNPHQNGINLERANNGYSRRANP